MSRLVPILVLALLAAACGGGSGSSETLAALNGEWRLTSGTGPSGEVDLSSGVEVTLTIDGEDWGGQVCNHYGAESVEVGDGTVAIREVFQTEMACLEEGWMEAEAAYLAAFREVEAYEVTSDELRLTGDGVELVYAPVEAEPPPDLIGTVWVLDTLITGTGPDGTASSTTGAEEAILELREDGTLVASSGCLTRADDGSSYALNGSQLITTFATTYDDDCPDEAAWAQDEHVWEVIESDPEFVIDGQRLTLTSGDLALGYRASEADDADDETASAEAETDGAVTAAAHRPAELGTADGVSCGPSPEDPGIEVGRHEVVTVPTGVRGDHRYDALDRWLAFRGTVVPAGCSLGAWLHVRNPTMQTVTIRACELGLGRPHVPEAAMGG